VVEIVDVEVEEASLTLPKGEDLGVLSLTLEHSPEFPDIPLQGLLKYEIALNARAKGFVALGYDGGGSFWNVGCVLPWHEEKWWSSSVSLVGMGGFDENGAINFGSPGVGTTFQLTPLVGESLFNQLDFAFLDRVSFGSSITLNYVMSSSKPIKLFYQGSFQYKCTEETAIFGGIYLAPESGNVDAFFQPPEWLGGGLKGVFGVRHSF
jgi:hypothetical protein